MRRKAGFVFALLFAALALGACAGGQAGEDGTDGGLRLFQTVCDADRALTLAKQSGAVVIEEMRLTSGGDVWDAFYRDAADEKPASVLVAMYYTLDPERVDPSLYEAEKDDYPQLFFYDLRFDGSAYTVSTRQSTRNAPESAETYAHLLHFTGTAPAGALFASYDYYVLADDPDVTWEQIEAGMFSAQSGDWIRHCVVCQNVFD